MNGIYITHQCPTMPTRAFIFTFLGQNHCAEWGLQGLTDGMNLLDVNFCAWCGLDVRWEIPYSSASAGRPTIGQGA